MSALLPHITQDSSINPQYSIIWLHGLGADGQDFAPMVKELKLPAAMRYLFPHAPMRAVTINGGYVMRAWYDIASDKIDARQDTDGIRKSQKAIEALIAQEKARGIAPDHIYLAGFSQGGAIALHTALRQNEALGGVIVLSAYLPLSDSLESEASKHSRQIPVFMAHGRRDPIVPLSLGLASKERLQALGYIVEWHEYEMEHSINDRELRDIEAWLCSRVR
jgi:phospholipase/carboxylesterase